MRITGFLWLEAVVEKIERKHHLDTAEVEAVFSRRPQVRFVETGKVIRKLDNPALIVTARDMDRKERRKYGKQA